MRAKILKCRPHPATRSTAYRDHLMRVHTFCLHLLDPGPLPTATLTCPCPLPRSLWHCGLTCSCLDCRLAANETANNELTAHLATFTSEKKLELARLDEVRALPCTSLLISLPAPMQTNLLSSLALTMLSSSPLPLARSPTAGQVTNSLEAVIAYSERFRGQCLALSGEMSGAVSTGLDSLGTKRAVEERVRVELNEAQVRLEAQRAKRSKQNNELLKHTATVTPKIEAQEAELVELEAEAVAQEKVHTLSTGHLTALRKELGLNEIGVANQATLDANSERAKETAEQVCVDALAASLSGSSQAEYTAPSCFGLCLTQLSP